MSVNAMVTVPSGADEAERSGRNSLTAPAISSTDVVRKQPSTSLATGIELCQCTSSHSPCSRARTQVNPISIAPSGATDLGPSSRPTNRALTQRVYLVDHPPAIATSPLPHLLDPEARRRCAVVTQ